MPSCSCPRMPMPCSPVFAPRGRRGNPVVTVDTTVNDQSELVSHHRRQHRRRQRAAEEMDAQTGGEGTVLVISASPTNTTGTQVEGFDGAGRRVHRARPAAGAVRLQPALRGHHHSQHHPARAPRPRQHLRSRRDLVPPVRSPPSTTPTIGEVSFDLLRRLRSAGHRARVGHGLGPDRTGSRTGGPTRAAVRWPRSPVRAPMRSRPKP